MYGGIPLSSSLLLTSSRSGSGSAISIGNRRRGSRSFFLGFYKFFRLGLSFLEYIQFLLLVTILVYNQIDHLIAAKIPNYICLIFNFLSTQGAVLLFLAPFVPTHPTTRMTAGKVYRMNQKFHTQ